MSFVFRDGHGWCNLSEEKKRYKQVRDEILSVWFLWQATSTPQLVDRRPLTPAIYYIYIQGVSLNLNPVSSFEILMFP